MLFAVVALVVVQAGDLRSTEACGPFFDPHALGDRDELLSGAPTRSFDPAMRAMLPPPSTSLRFIEAPDPLAQARAADLDDLTTALAASTPTSGSAHQVLARVAATRDAIALLKEKPSKEGCEAADAQLDVRDVPPELGHYLAGALAFHCGKLDAARDHFRSILALPDAERRHRSTWAAYMLGRLRDGAGRFAEVRKLAKQGFEDRLGLAAASLSAEAKDELGSARYDEAATLYAEAAATGDPTAISSLRMVAEAMIAEEQRGAFVALDRPMAQRAMVAYLLTNAEATHTSKAPEGRAMEAMLALSEGKVEIPGAARLAWASYRAGDMKRAEAWLERAHPKEPVARWVRSKLELRAGHPDEARAELVAILEEPAQAIAPLHRPRIEEELAALELGRRDWFRALDRLVSTGIWNDVAYVAERVLTLPELERYVREKVPEPLGDATRAEVEEDEDERAASSGPRMAKDLRYLLARRLARSGSLAVALPFYPKEMRAQVTAYAKLLGDSQHAVTRADRARARWGAAKITRTDGMELLGTELQPDWHLHGGNFQEGDVAPTKKPKIKGSISAEERERYKASGIAPDKRFHYRYVAAELALSAAKELPKGAPEIQEALCGAFRWLKNRDPKAAKKYWKELSRRAKGATCARTEE